MIDIDIVVVNWNACKDLRACLESLAATPQPIVSHCTYVVDNASSDGSAAMVRSEFPDVELMQNSDNLGFSKANNQAIKASHGRYILMLNSDAAIFPGALDALVTYADENPKAGVVGAKVLNPDGSLQYSCRRFPSIWAGFFRNTLMGRLFPRNRFAREYLMGDFNHNESRTVDWVSGCAMLLRREMIDQIGALDERFYMYCEDVDICYRAWRSGYEVHFTPTAMVMHTIGRSSDKNPEKMIVEFHVSWYEFVKKHFPGNPLLHGVVYAGLWLRAAVRIRNRRRYLHSLNKCEGSSSGTAKFNAEPATGAARRRD